MTGLLRFLLMISMIGLATGIVAGFAGALHPVFDTLSSFRLHFGIALAVLAALWSLKCSRVPALLFAVIAFGGVAGSAPGLPLNPNPARAEANDRIYRLFAMNLLWNNPTPDKVFDAIAAHDPDFVMVTEYSRGWARRLATLEAHYAYRFHCPEWGRFGGNMILSRLPLEHQADYCGDNASLGLTQFRAGNKNVALGMTHLRWPWPASGPRQITALTPALRQLGPDAIIAGDFNAVSWSHSVRRFNAAGGLRPVAGIGPSWGPGVFIGGRLWQFPQWLGLPIDNAAVKGGVEIVNATTLPHAGSDHLPVLIDFVVR